MILCIGTTPALQRVMVFRALKLDAVNRAATTLDGAAGKSVNVAKVLQALGEHPFATGFLGGEHGESVRAVFTARHIEHEFIPVPTPTRQCITVIDQATGNITELVEESRPVDPAHYDQLTQIIRRRAAGSRALVMSGTITPGGPVQLYRACTQTAHEAGALSVVDAQGPALIEALKAKPGLVKPNRLELAATVGRPLTDQPALVAALRELHERGAQRIVVTAGKDPTLASDGKTLWTIQPPAITPVNPIGSGDSSTATLVWRLLRGDDLGEAARWAAAAGAANALSLMPGELEPGDVERLAAQTTVSRLTL